MIDRNLVEFGGYLPLELPEITGGFFDHLEKFSRIEVNSGRTAFFLAAKSLSATKVFLPHFTCPQTVEPFQDLGLKIEFYKLAEDLTPLDVPIEPRSLLLWTNYYGSMPSGLIDSVVERYWGRIILDNCHAFFSPPREGAFNVYSARKFFGVSDGAYLIAEGLEDVEELETDLSHLSTEQMLIQLDIDTHSGYQKNLENERRLARNYKGMSNLTRRILSTINYSRVEALRRQNFEMLNRMLGQYNEFELQSGEGAQMYYPLLTSDPELRQRLVRKKVYSPTWWAHILSISELDGSIEQRLSQNMTLLPIDQRYRQDDMADLCKLVLDEISKA